MQGANKGKGKGKGKGPPPPSENAKPQAAAAGYGKRQSEEEKIEAHKVRLQKLQEKSDEAAEHEIDKEDQGFDADALAAAKLQKEAGYIKCHLCGYKCPPEEMDRHVTGHESCILEADQSWHSNCCKSWLFLGSKDNVNVKTMYRRGITHILNVADSLHLEDDQTTCIRLLSFTDDLRDEKERLGEDDEGLQFVVRSFNWDDREEFVTKHMINNIDGSNGDTNLSIRTATKWIHDRKEANKKVLVHCSMGISRSSATVMAYLMEYEGMSLKQAWEHTLAQRRIIRPNPGFLMLLGELEMQLKQIEAPSLTPDDVDNWERKNGKLLSIAGTFAEYADKDKTLRTDIHQDVSEEAGALQAREHQAQTIVKGDSLAPPIDGPPVYSYYMAKISHVVKNGDKYDFAIENGRFILYFNGSKRLCQRDGDGVVTKLIYRVGRPVDLRDQLGWGSDDFPWNVAQKLKDMADAVGVLHNIPHHSADFSRDATPAAVPPVYSYVMQGKPAAHENQAQVYVKGEQVEIFSKSHQKWFPGIVDEVFPSDCVFNGFEVKAGVVLVRYAIGSKFVPSQDFGINVRKHSPAPAQATS